MKTHTASVRDIRQKFGQLLKAVRDGETVTITSRKKVVAVLAPPPPREPAKRPWAELEARLAAQPERSTLDLAAMLSEDRDDMR